MSSGRSVYHSVRAEQCSYGSAHPGRTTVVYRGAEYAIIGLFFVPGNDGRRHLSYILRSIDSDRNGLRGWRADKADKKAKRGSV